MTFRPGHHSSGRAHLESGSSRNLRRVLATTKPVVFRLHAPEARRVCVAGDFNHWSPHAHPMHKTVDGYWHLTVELKRGRHHYRFIVDGTAMLDPKSRGQIQHPHSGPCSVIEVGY